MHILQEAYPRSLHEAAFILELTVGLCSVNVPNGLSPPAHLSCGFASMAVSCIPVRTREGRICVSESI